MKKMIAMLTLLIGMSISAKAMDYESARQEALFLTDKMAYELNLTEDQYEAAYEVNLDYLMSLNTYNDAYDTFWVRRNTDLSYILLDWQYQAFCAATYFYRPLFWDNGWRFYIYHRYPRHDHFFFGHPHFYHSYHGGHAWHNNGGHSWYHGHTFGNGGRPGMHDTYRGGNHAGNRGGAGPRPGFGGNRNHGGDRNHGGGNNSGSMHGNGGNNGNNHGSFGGNRGNGGGNRDNGFRQGRESSTRTTGSGVQHQRVERSQGSFGGGSSTPQRSFGGGSSTPQRSFGGSSSTPQRSFGGSSSTPQRSFGGGSRGGGSSFSGGGSRGGGFSGGSHGGGSHGGGASHGGGRR